MAFNTPLDRQFYPLAADLKATDLTFDLLGRFIKTSAAEVGAGTEYQIGNQVVTFSVGEGQSSQESAIIRVASNPELIDPARGVYRYTIVSGERGLDSDNATDDVGSIKSQTDNRKLHNAGKFVGVVVSGANQAQLENTFETNTSLVPETANGSIGLGKVYYLDGSGLAVQGVDGTVFTGIATEAAGDTETFPGALPPRRVSGITVPGSIGDDVYSDSNGDLTATPTNNHWVGNKSGANSLDFQKRAEQNEEYDNSMLGDENQLKLMYDINVKDFSLDGSEVWSNSADETSDTMFLDETAKTVTADATPANNVDSVHTLGATLDFTESGGGDVMDGSDFIQAAMEASDATKIDKCILFLRTSAGAFTDYFESDDLSADLVTGEYKGFELKKNLFSSNGSADWADINDVVLRISASDGSTPTVTISPKSLQVVRKDTDDNDKANPFLKDGSISVYEVLYNKVGFGGIFIENGEYKICPLSDGNDELLVYPAKQWKSFSCCATVEKGKNADVRGFRISKGDTTIERQGVLIDSTNFAIQNKAGSPKDSETITACDYAEIYYTKDNTKMEAKIRTNEGDFFTLDGDDSVGNTTDFVRFTIRAKTRLKNFKITNTEAVCTNPKTKFLANRFAIQQSTDPTIELTSDIEDLTEGKSVKYVEDNEDVLVQLTGDQQTTSSSDVLATNYDLELEDEGGNFASDVYTAPVDGTYKITYDVTLAGQDAADTCRARLKKNATGVLATHSVSGVTETDFYHQVVKADLIAGDTISWYFARSAGSAANVLFRYQNSVAVPEDNRMKIKLLAIEL